MAKLSAEEAIAMIAAGRDSHRSGDLEGALTRFETVLRLVTPDDRQIELAMTLNRGSGVSEHRKADELDSMLRSELTHVLLGLGRPDEAIHHARIALYLDRCLYGSAHTNVSQCHHDLGSCHVALAKKHGSRDASEAALMEFGASEVIDRRIVTEPVFKRRRERRDFYAQFGLIVEAAQHATWIANHRPEDDNVDLLVADLTAAGQCLQELGEHHEGLEYARRAIETRQAATGSVPDFLFENLGFMLFEQGRIADAELQLRRSNRFLETKVVDFVEREKDRLRKWAVAGESRHDIFLSYSSADESLVNALVSVLDKAGASVWTFKKAPDWTTQRDYEQIVGEMVVEIAASGLMILVVSDTAVGSEYVYQELSAARKNDLPIAVWYPHGSARVDPRGASSKPNLEDRRKNEFVHGLTGGGRYAYFGTGLRAREGHVIAHAMLKLFARIYPSQKLSRAVSARAEIQDALDATMTWPMYVGADGRPIRPEDLRQGKAQPQ